MKVYKDMRQQTEDWFCVKYGKLGGSTLKHLMIDKPIKECAIFNNLLSARFEEYEYEETFTSSDMERGNMYEPLARAEYERVYGIKVDEYGWIEMDNSIAGISPDGIIGKKFLKAIEIKCPNRVTHTAYVRNPVSMVEEYLWQAVMYFTVLEKLKMLHFISYRPENKMKPLLVYDVTRKTEVKVSAKQTSTIGELAKHAQYKINLLKEAIKFEESLLTPQF